MCISRKIVTEYFFFLQAQLNPETPQGHHDAEWYWARADECLKNAAAQAARDEIERMSKQTEQAARADRQPPGDPDSGKTQKMPSAPGAISGRAKQQATCQVRECSVLINKLFECALCIGHYFTNKAELEEHIRMHLTNEGWASNINAITGPKMNRQHAWNREKQILEKIMKSALAKVPSTQATDNQPTSPVAGPSGVSQQQVKSIKFLMSPSMVA
ncbi:hypothetical protein B566_EDAN014038 [Ephemera danica]|nr:hypothetical protein B566_EDAN014038 [Ephemera danica]